MNWTSYLLKINSELSGPMESPQTTHRKESGTQAELLHSQIFYALDSMWLSSSQLSANKEPILSNIAALNSYTLGNSTILTNLRDFIRKQEFLFDESITNGLLLILLWGFE